MIVTKEQLLFEKQQKEEDQKRIALEKRQQQLEREALIMSEENLPTKCSKLEELEKLQDDYLNWLTYYSPTHPKWNEVVGRYHAVECKIKKETTRSSFSGINEVSTIGFANR